MIRLHRALLIGVLVAPLAQAKMTPDQIAALPPAPSRPVDFPREIKPLLENRCINCHGRGRSKGGFKMDTRQTFLRGGDSGPAVVPGRSTESLLIELVAGADPDSVMPKKGSRLTPEQIGLLRAWIDQGTPWDEKVSFGRREPLNLTPKPEKLRLAALERGNPIDQILRQSGDSQRPQAGENRSADAVPDGVYARRVYLDVVGMLPTPEELDVFMADSSPDKRPKLAHRLLNDDRRYAEHWLSFWNDLLRNDYRGTGYIDGGRQQITPWLFSALSTNMAYDEFVRQLINPKPETEGFAKGIVWRGVVNASQTPEMQAAQNISQVFMGVNLKCASCHDSFINDWRLSDAYGLAAIYHEGPLEMFQCDKPTGQTAAAGFIYPELGTVDAGADKAKRLESLAAIITGPQDGRLARTMVNRLWARFFGRGLVEPVDDMEKPAWNPDLLDWLAEDLVVNRYDLKKTIERMVTSEAYQMPTVDLGDSAAKDYVFKGPAMRRLTAEQFRDALGQLTTVFFDKGDFKGSTGGPVRASFVAADPLMTALGRPNREQVVAFRSSTPTTLQALELMNGETLAAVLTKGAEKLTLNSLSTEQLVASAFKQGLGRDPTPAERRSATELAGSPLRKEGVEDLLWAIAMLPEFQVIY